MTMTKRMPCRPGLRVLDVEQDRGWWTGCEGGCGGISRNGIARIQWVAVEGYHEIGGGGREVGGGGMLTEAAADVVHST